MITKKYIREAFSNIPSETPLYNCDYDVTTLIKHLDGLIHITLDPIIVIYENDGECQFGGDDFILTVKDLFDISENFEGEVALNRDVEDRFVYSDYKHWLYYKDKLVFY